MIDHNHSGYQIENDTIYTIPIHAYLILNSDGVVSDYIENRLLIKVEDIENRFRDKVSFLNDNFHPQLQFEVCRFDTVHAQPLVNIGSSFYPNLWMRQNRPWLVSETSNHEVQVFLNEGNGQQWGSFPDGILLSPAFESIGVMMHEFGHYFGLFHTSHASFGRDENNDGCIGLYPDDTYVTGCVYQGTSPGTDESCAGVESGYCTGDLVPDTPVDVTRISAKCNADFVIEINGEDITYEVDYANLMRARASAFTYFTEGQRQRMLATFLGEVPANPPPLGPNAVDQPDWSVLRQVSRTFEQEGLCTSNSTEPMILYSFSNWNLLKFGSGSVDLEPFTRAKVICEGRGRILPFFTGDSITLSANVYNGKMRVPAVINNEGSVRFFTDEILDICDPDGQLERRNLNILDAIEISEHILDISPFESPFQYIASDVNNSGSVTTADIVGVVRNILLDEEFIVPKYRFFPELALHEDFDFADDFNANPFQAMWTFGGETYKYKENSDCSSYLGDKAGPGAKTNTVSFSHSFPSNYAQTRKALSFWGIESGNVYQEDEVTNRLPGKVIVSLENASSNLKGKLELTFKAKNDIGIRGAMLCFQDGFKLQKSDIINASTSFSKADFENVQSNQNGKLLELLCDNSGVVLLNAGGKYEASKGEVIFSLTIDTHGEILREEDLQDLMNESQVALTKSKNLNLIVTSELVTNRHVSVAMAHSIKNPTNSTALFDITPVKKGNYSIVLFDYTGKPIEVDLGKLEAGRPYRFDLDASSLKEGVGFYVVKSSLETASGILIIK